MARSGRPIRETTGRMTARRWAVTIAVTGAVLTVGAAGVNPAAAAPAGASTPGASTTGTAITGTPITGTAAGRGVTPIVLFPAYHFTTLRVTVRNQRTDPACPASGSFEDRFGSPQTSRFSPVCRDELITLRYRDNRRVPMPHRFSEQPGVRVSILNYGNTASAPFYQPMYQALEKAGYVRDRSIRVAGYDARLTPDMAGFLERTQRLVEQTYRENGNRPVHLVGHSNGPIYAQYLLTHTSQAWKDRYVHGFTPIAGNFPGQGLLYATVFLGLNLDDLTLPATPEKALAAARMMQTAPSTWLSAADPSVFASKEVVVKDSTTGRSYTPADWPALLHDARLDRLAPIARYYIGFVRFAERRAFPNVDVYAEKGSGLETLVGLSLKGLAVGQLVDADTEFVVRDGDINQEDLTNDAVSVWAGMRCHRFTLTDNPGVDHFSLPGDPSVLARLIATAGRPRIPCNSPS
jgi:lecithin-cholesterol acyltransferase